MTCPHIHPDWLASYAPMPCERCRGWVEADGNVIRDRRALIDRYPFVEPLVPKPPGMIALAGALSRTLLAIIFAAAALAIIIAILVALVT